MIVGAILQGGRSARMGRDKAGVVVGGQTMRERVRDALAAVCERVLLVGGDGADITDDGDSAFAGVRAAVGAVGEGDRVVVCAVDVPLIDGPLLQRLLDAGDDVCFARHPLPLVVSAASRGRVEALWRAGERRLSSIAGRTLPVDDGTEARLWNVNTPADVVEAERRLLALR